MDSSDEADLAAWIEEGEAAEAAEEARKRARTEANVPEIFDLANLVPDPGIRRPIDSMICYAEKEIFAQIDDKKIMLRFHAYSNRRGHLPRGFRLPSMDST